MSRNNPTPYSPLRAFLSIDHKLIKKVQALPKKEDVTLHFVDFDGTLLDDQYRFEIDPELAHYRWDSAYYYITRTCWTKDDPTGFINFVKKMDPKNHLLKGSSEFFDPKNPHHIILTAGNTNFQKEKIYAAWFGEAKKILVPKAVRKPEMILLYLLKIGYIPGKIRFYDDRIENFEWYDALFSEELSTEVEFFKAIQDSKKQTVKVERMVSDILAITQI